MLQSSDYFFLNFLQRWITNKDQIGGLYGSSYVRCLRCKSYDQAITYRLACDKDISRSQGSCISWAKLHVVFIGVLRSCIFLIKKMHLPTTIQQHKHGEQPVKLGILRWCSFANIYWPTALKHVLETWC